MLADGASTILEDMEMRERHAAAAMDGWSRYAVSQGNSGPFGMMTSTMQGANLSRLQPQHQAQFTWRGLGDGQVQAQGGQYGMGRRTLADGNATLIDFNSTEALTSRGSATPSGHVFAAPGWHAMVQDASAQALARGILRTDPQQGRPPLAHVAAQAAGWGGAAPTSHWWAAGVSTVSPRSNGLGVSGPSPGGPVMFQAAMQGFGADASRFPSSNATPTSQMGADTSMSSNACSSQTAESPAESWNSGSADAKGNSSGRNKRKRPPSLSCIEAAAVGAPSRGDDCFSFSNITSRRRVDQDDEGIAGSDAGANSLSGGSGSAVLLPPLPTSTSGLKWGGSSGSSVASGNSSSGNGGNGSNVGSGPSGVVLAPLTPMTPFAVGDGWTLPMTPQRAAQPDGWTPTGASAEALARGDSWTFSITPRTPRDLTLQVM